MKITILLIIILFESCTVFANEKIIKNEIDYPIIEETVLKSKNNIICKNGMLFLKAKVQVDGTTQLPFIFIIDTGSANSTILSESYSELNRYFEYKIDNTDYIYCKAFFSDFTVSNWYLKKEYNELVIATYKSIFNDGQYYFGILGNDVLMHKSFYLSISDGFFQWTNDNPLTEHENVISPLLDRICSSRGNKDFYQYSIYIEDDYFKSNPKDSGELGFFNSPDGTKSRYIIDTGTYFIATSLKDLYYQIKNKKYKHFFYENEIQKTTGFCEIPKANFLDYDFNSLMVIAGRTPLYFKCLGNQTLSAFDIYFDKENTEKVQHIYFHPTSNELYTKYRNENDKTYFYPASTFGFCIKKTSETVSEVAVIGKKELLPSVEFGDTIISINNIPINQVNEWELTDNILLKLKKKNGKIRIINARKYKL